MSVYVDRMTDHGKRIGRAGPCWCHMIADSVDELHAMARRIGLKREWFQDESFPHYDIGTFEKRAQALALGATQCDSRTFVGHMRRIRAERAAARGGKDGE